MGTFIQRNIRRVAAVIVSALCIIPVSGQADSLFTLKRCIETAIESNLSLQAKGQEVEKNRYAIYENRARLLPQLQAFGGFVDYVKRPATVLTSTPVGVPLTEDATLLESRSTKYQLVGGIQLTLPLYNQTLYTTLNIAKQLKEIGRLSYEKACEDLTVQVAQLFYLAQTTQEQTQLAYANIRRLTALREITLAAFENGTALEIDVQRVDINLENTTVQYNNSQSLYDQQLNLLRYVMGISPEQPFGVEACQETPEVYAALEGGLSAGLYEIQLVEAQQKTLELQRKSIWQGYLPALSFTGQLGGIKYANRFNRMFNSKDTPDWYKTFYWGISLQLPLFDGFDKRSRLNQNKVQQLQNRLQLEDTKQHLQTQYDNAVNDYLNSQRNFQKQKDNYQLAENVYEITVEKYREGIASMTEVLQDEIGMNSAQTHYVNAHYSYKLSELQLLKLSQRLNLLTH